MCKNIVDSPREKKGWLSWERPNHVEPPASEGPGWRYGDWLVGRDVLLLGEVLEPLAPLDKFFDITQSCGPVESSLEGLADQRA
jgi:hypothetical protein